MNTITASASTRKFANSNQLKKAAAIRREAAAALGVRPGFIGFGECMKRAMGKKTPLKTCFGTAVNSMGYWIDLYLSSEDCAMVLDSESIAAATVLPESKVREHLAWLVSNGFIVECSGWAVVKDSARPYTNAIGEGESFEVWQEARQMRAALALAA
jgi:hypothetical protein